MVIYVPGTEETDQKKQNMSLQQIAGAATTAIANISTNTANIATNTTNIATNTANIATNTTNVAALQAAITALQPAVAKAWATWTGSTGALRASYNVSSVTRTSAGQYTVNFTTPFASVNYSAVAGVSASGQIFTTVETSTQTASSVVVFVAIGGTPTDPSGYATIQCFGTQ